MYNEACFEYNPKEDFHSNFATWFNLVAEELLQGAAVIARRSVQLVHNYVRALQCYINSGGKYICQLLKTTCMMCMMMPIP